MGQIQIKSLSQCTLNEITELWNSGFQQDYNSILHTPWQRMSRMARCHIHPELSVAAFAEKQPAGFVLIGWQDIYGRKLAWNGGTGVVPAFRGQGLSKRLLTEAIRRVTDAGAESLSLEARTDNEPAIRAYRSCGFETLDTVHVLRRKGGFDRIPFQREVDTGFVSIRGIAERVGRLPFYCSQLSSWTNHWFNLEGSESLIVYDLYGNASGYALFRNHYDDEGKLTAVELYHCERAPSRQDGRDVILYMMAEIMKPEVIHLTRTAHYIRGSNTEALDALKKAGFEQVKEEYLMLVSFAANRSDAGKETGATV